MFSRAMLGVLMLFLAAPAAGQMTFEVDPCIFLTAEQLQAKVESGVASEFPMSERGVTLSNPRVVAATCPNFRTELRADIRYQKKKTAVGTVSTSGQARFGSPMVAYITYAGGGFPPSPPNIQIAEACLTNIRVLGLDLRGSPNWLDQSWLRSQLNKGLERRKCFSVTEEAVSYAQSGGQFKPVGQAGSVASSSKDTKTGAGQVRVPATNVTVSDSTPTDIAIRGRPAADHPGTDRQPVPPGEKTGASLPPPLEETAPTKQSGAPDVTAHIRQDIMDYGTRYRAKITVENLGSAAMPQVKVNTYGVPNHHIAGKTPPSLEECMYNPLVSCIRHKTTVGPLAPGQKQAFHAGGKQPRTTTLYVHVIIECGTPAPGGATQGCAESNTENNKVNRVLGPH